MSQYSPDLDIDWLQAISDSLPAVLPLHEIVFVTSAPWVYVVPVILAVAGLVFVRRWKRQSFVDDRALKAQYTPPAELTPGELGLLYHMDAEDERLIFGELAWLMTNGYIAMQGTGSSASLKKTDAYDPHAIGLKSHQHRIMAALFGEKEERSLGESVKISKEYFQAEVVARLKVNGYIRHDPRSSKGVVKHVWLFALLACFGTVGWVLGIVYIASTRFMRQRALNAPLLLAVTWGMYGQLFLNLLALEIVLGSQAGIASHAFFIPSIPAVLNVLIVTWVLKQLPARTQKGARAYRRSVGFLDYLKTAELARANYVEEKEGSVSDFSAYALVFKLPSRWDDAFSLVETGEY